jgi:hypothetical protein
VACSNIRHSIGERREQNNVVARTATLLAISIASASAKDKLSETFLKKAIEGNFAEISMGDLAQKNGQSDGVKS